MELKTDIMINYLPPNAQPEKFIPLNNLKHFIKQFYSNNVAITTITVNGLSIAF